MNHKIVFTKDLMGGGKSSFLIAVFIKALLKVTNKDSKTIAIRKAVA